VGVLSYLAAHLDDRALPLGNAGAEVGDEVATRAGPEGRLYLVRPREILGDGERGQD
jgi:hypothetical protein